jgi:integrase
VEVNLTTSSKIIKQKRRTPNEKAISELLEEWIATGDYSTRTLATYTELARLIIRSGLTVDDFNEPRVCQEKFVERVFKPEWAKRTVAARLAGFCSFGNWLAHQHYTSARHQPLKKLSRRPQQREIPTEEEIHALLTILRDRYRSATDTPNRQRSYGKDYLLTALLIETGARIGEAVAIERRDLIRHQSGEELHHAILLRGTKTDAAERAVMISAELYEQLQTYCRRWELTGHVFVTRTGNPLPQRTYSQWLSGFCEELQLSCHVSPHTFRYRFILNLIAQGKSALEVMTRAGHSDVQMTIYYFNQVRRLMPWVQVNGDIALLEQRRKFWQGRREVE